MRSLKLWTSLVHLLLLCLVSDRLMAAPSLTTVQDTLYKADGTRFNGVAYIEWKSFQSSDSSAIATANLVVPINSGALRVRLVPTTNASVGARYIVRYHAEGKVQFTETWNVPPSNTALSLAAVRVPNGAATGGETTPPAAVTIEDVAGLTDELSARPVKGFVYAPNRILMSGPTGALEAVQGNLADCIRVDGTSGPCGTTGGGYSGPGFVDQEVPAGAANGSNTVFTLSQPPSPPASLQLFRNGVFLKQGVDFSISGATITFGALSVPQTGDLLLASYRLASESNPSGLAAGALTGTFPAPQIAEGVISNFNIAPAAGIAESKLSLNFPTHSNANDPTPGEKAALTGTAGIVGAGNKYVTELDARLSDSRPPTSHGLLSGAHSDTEPGQVQRGDLIVGANSGSTKWKRLPLGPENRCLVSNGSDAVWNTCLFTGFTPGAVAFTEAGGTLSQSPMHFFWDSVNRRLSVGSNVNSSTLTVHDGGSANAVTTLTVRGAQSQGNNPLQRWLDPAGSEIAQVSSDGRLTVRSVEAASTVQRSGWRESGTASDPTVRVDGDAWYNSAGHVRKSHDGGQTHTTPQVICSAAGDTTSSLSLVQLGSCTIPASLLRSGDRLAIRATWAHTGTNGGFSVRWNWGTAAAGTHSFAASVTLVDNKGDAALHAGGVVVENSYVLHGGASGTALGAVSGGAGAPVTIGLQGNLNAAGDSLSLLQFTVIRYPAQTNP